MILLGYAAMEAKELKEALKRLEKAWGDGGKRHMETERGVPFTEDYVKKCLYIAMSIGEEMLIAGAEVHRVEDSISRICYAYGMERVDVLTITTSIVTTVYGEGFGSVTQTRRIKEQNYHLERLEELNSLSRLICEKKPELWQAGTGARRLLQTKEAGLVGAVDRLCLHIRRIYSVFRRECTGCAASLLIGILMKMSEMILEKLQMNRLLFNFLRAAVGGILAECLIGIGLGMHFE